QFAVATAMRLDEICRVEWTDLDLDRRMLLIRDRKDPRNKTGNDQRIPLFAATGFDAWALVTPQAKQLRRAKGRIFPYYSRSVGTAFRRACVEVSIKDLHFQDLRHEGTSLSGRLTNGNFRMNSKDSVRTMLSDLAVLVNGVPLRKQAFGGAATSPFFCIAAA
ncbi:MAG: tyrosine-type recombinase/integrase, partial [Albidovulum sp.]